MRIAIIGSGISGMAAAHRLHAKHAITLFEGGDHVGGHTATLDVEVSGREYAIDTGFIVFNDWTYPGFVALLDELGVASQDSNMSFSLRCERSGLEYNGASLDSLFAQRRNLLRPSFLRMLAQILRFNRESRALLSGHDFSLTLGEFLQRNGYARPFVELYLVPMGRAIWSATEAAMLSFPARFFVDFFDRHGFLNVHDRPTWRAVRGGSRTYAQRLVAPFRDRIRLRTAITSVKRGDRGVTLFTASGRAEQFEAVLFACHSDTALALLQDPTPAEREVLGAFPYQANQVLLHTDIRMLPRNLRARAAWNYHVPATPQEAVELTYDMNVLMSLESPVRFLVSLNRNADVEPRSVLRSLEYHHPVYTPGAVRAQSRRAEVSGVNHTFFCGAYWGFGFHEDGLMSGYQAADEIDRYTERHRDALERCA